MFRCTGISLSASCPRLSRASTPFPLRPKKKGVDGRNKSGHDLGKSAARRADDTDMTRRHAEIVGAGFAGLTAACALAQRGWSVRVHERADRLRTTGAGIYIYENGLRVLEAVGAYADAVQGAPFAHTRQVRDGSDRLIAVHRWSGSRVFSIVRQNVINALATAATRAGAEIVTDSAAIGAAPEG